MIHWPCDMAEQCNRHREKGGQCLSAASLPAAGVGETRREPEGPCHGQHGFGHLCRNKSGSSCGGETPAPHTLKISLATFQPFTPHVSVESQNFCCTSFNPCGTFSVSHPGSSCPTLWPLPEQLPQQVYALPEHPARNNIESLPTQPGYGSHSTDNQDHNHSEQLGPHV